MFFDSQDTTFSRRAFEEMLSWASDDRKVLRGMVFGDEALSMFRLKKDFKGVDSWYWLQDIEYPFRFARRHPGGHAGSTHASDVGGVRPAFAIF